MAQQKLQGQRFWLGISQYYSRPLTTFLHRLAVVVLPLTRVSLRAPTRGAFKIGERNYSVGS